MKSSHGPRNDVSTVYTMIGLLSGSVIFVKICHFVQPSMVAGLVDECLPAIIAAGATALICSYDEIAIAAIKKCREMKIRVPADLSIIGFDDHPLAQRVSPALTTLRQDRFQLGKSGYYALSCLINGVSISTILLHPDLILRESTT